MDCGQCFVLLYTHPDQRNFCWGAEQSYHSHCHWDVLHSPTGPQMHFRNAPPLLVLPSWHFLCAKAPLQRAGAEEHGEETVEKDFCRKNWHLKQWWTYFAFQFVQWCIRWCESQSSQCQNSLEGNAIWREIVCLKMTQSLNNYLYLFVHLFFIYTCLIL